MLKLLFFLLQIQSKQMGIGRQYIDKVRHMDDDEKQELMKGLRVYFVKGYEFISLRFL